MTLHKSVKNCYRQDTRKNIKAFNYRIAGIPYGGKMKADKKYDSQQHFWEHAGKEGYNNVIFSNSAVADHIVGKQNAAALSVAKSLGLDEKARVLELGCGDGEFAEYVLSPRFQHIDAFEQSASAVEQARLRSKGNNIQYHVADLSTHNFDHEGHWDGAFCIAFLHHVKSSVPSIVARLAKVAPKVVILESNGDNIIRKGLELTPSYKSAGEDSFRLKRLLQIFAENHYHPVVLHRITFVPSICPESLFPFFRKIEEVVEASSFLNRLCSSYVIGFQQK